ncbi:MAG: hypothetical protein ACLFV2_07830 [Desulfurivibrionaceae bacterium]
MKKSVWLLVTTAFFTSLLWSSTVSAGGLDGFIGVSGGSGEAEKDSDIDSWDIDSNSVAGCFVFDISPANQSLFNYRLNVGFAGQDFEDVYDDSLESTGIYIENIFGFAIIKKESLCWWLGPLVRIGYYTGEDNSLLVGTDLEGDYAEFGVGAVTGLNFKAGTVTMFPSIGLRYSGYDGTGDVIYNGYSYEYSYKNDIDDHATTFFANFAILF